MNDKEATKVLLAPYLPGASLDDLLRLARFAKTALPRQQPFESVEAYRSRLVRAILRGCQRTRPRAQRAADAREHSSWPASRSACRRRRPHRPSATEI